MTIDEAVWEELNSGEQDSGLHWRRIHPESTQDLRVAFDATTNTRRLMYLRKWADDQALITPESTRSIGVTSRRDSEGTEIISVTLLDASLADVFNALATDVASVVAAAEGPALGIVALNARLGRWQQLLARIRDRGLSAIECRGLFGELHVLEGFLIPRMGRSAALQSWTGPLAANQDFQGSDWAIEVKTTSAKQPQDFTVNNERELDGTGVNNLVLIHLSFDERRGGVGTSLNLKIDGLRDLMSESIGDLNQFNSLLLRVGYLDEHREKYEAVTYTKRHEMHFVIVDGFPRIVEGDLLSGVGDTVYRVDLVACEPFIVSLDDLVARLFGEAVSSGDY